MSLRQYLQGSKSRDLTAKNVSEDASDNANKSFNFRILKDSRDTPDDPGTDTRDRVNRTMKVSSKPTADLRPKDSPSPNAAFFKQQSDLLLQLANLQDELDNQKEQNRQLSIRNQFLEQQPKAHGFELEKDNKRLQQLVQKQLAIIDDFKAVLAQKDVQIRRLSEINDRQAVLAMHNPSVIQIDAQSDFSEDLREIVAKKERVRYVDNKRTLRPQVSEKMIGGEEVGYKEESFVRRQGVEPVEGNRKQFTFKNPANGVIFEQ